MTITEMDGRIEELERQRNEALTRCAKLSGMNALLRQTLGEARGEIQRLNGFIPQAKAPVPEEQPSTPTIN
ncbi:hypothetical protein [Methylobacterium sp.]|uniref:hypothetical protein n=1 Tax=Methylobacterium sp. TaxID=409 RepID=UPI0025F67315|nr:hypothetical protein [Methylobacterium sp.]MBY0258996.1 hypothetical protein [Methylobacterium sp.]